MRYSLIAWLGGVFASIVACGDGDPLGVGTRGSAGAPAAGTAGNAGKGGRGSGGTAGATNGGSSGSTSKGSSGAGGTGRGGNGGAGGKGGDSAAGSSGTGTAGGGQGGGSSGTGAGGNDAGARGEDDGGQGGASDGGEGGAPGEGCPGGEVSCDERCIDPAERALDQRQLDMPGSIGLSVRQRPGQSFTVGASGLLKGIEVALGPCNGSDTTGRVRMELFGANQESLGHVTIEQASLPVVCGGDPLVEGATGAGYFDLTPLCLAVEAGDVLTFMLSVVDNPVATCDQTTFQCSSGGRSCDFDQECEGFFYVGETNCGGVGCEIGPNDYAGGTEVMQDPTTLALTPGPGFDLAFKTFVE